MQTWALNSLCPGLLCFRMTALVSSLEWRFWVEWGWVEWYTEQGGPPVLSKAQWFPGYYCVYWANIHPWVPSVREELYQENKPKPLCPHSAHCFMSQSSLKCSYNPKQLLSHNGALRGGGGSLRIVHRVRAALRVWVHSRRTINLSSLRIVQVGSCKFLHKVKICRI